MFKPLLAITGLILAITTLGPTSNQGLIPPSMKDLLDPPGSDGCEPIESKSPSSQITVTQIPQVESEGALKRIWKEMQESFRTKKCEPSKTFFAFDIDETTLITHEKRGASGEVELIGEEIRSSSTLLKEMQEVGVSTVALTIRDVISSATAYLLTKEQKRRKNPKADLSIISEGCTAAGEISDDYLFKHIQITQANLEQAHIHLQTGIQSLKGGGFQQKGLASKSGEGFFRLEKDAETISFSNPEHLKKALYYSNGLIMASHQSKGEVLKRFLELKGKTADFSCVFFADDQDSNIQAMKQSYEKTMGKNVFLYQVPNPLIK